jgi:hypothetical protein
MPPGSWRATASQRRSIWRNWIVGFSIPIAFVTVLFGIVDAGLTWSELFSWRFARVVGLTLIVAVVAGYWIGRGAQKDPVLKDHED